MTDQPIYTPTPLPTKGVDKTLVFLLLGVVFFGIMFVYLLFKNRQVVQVVTDDSTGIAVDTQEDAGEVTNLKVALRQYVPITFDTATVTYDYQSDKLAISYCGDYEKVIVSLRDHLVSLKLDNRSFDESEILFTKTGECQK